MNRSIPSPCETIIDCSTRIIWWQFCVHDVWHKQIKDLKASRKIPLRYVGHADPKLEDVMREGKQFGAKCYGQNQLSWSENRCTKWKNNTVDYGVQKVWIPPSINTSYMAIPPCFYIFTTPSINKVGVCALWRLMVQKICNTTSTQKSSTNWRSSSNEH